MTSNIRETPCFDVEEPKVRSPKRARLDESTVVKVADFTDASGENHDDDNGAREISAAAKRMNDAMKTVVKEFKEKATPTMMFAIFVVPEAGERAYAYVAPQACESVKKMKVLLKRCIETPDTGFGHGPYDYQLISIMSFVIDNPTAEDDNFLLDFANILEDETKQDELTQSGSESVDADLVNVKKVIGEELYLWQRMDQDGLSSIDENPEQLYQFCLVNGSF